MSEIDLLLLVRAAGRPYLVRRAEVAALSLDSARTHDDRGKPLTRQPLGPLLDPHAPPSDPHHALFVALRRRTIAFLVERIEDAEQLSAGALLPLAPFLARRLARPWVAGVVLRDDVPLIVLNLRQIAQDVLMGDLPLRTAEVTTKF